MDDYFPARSMSMEEEKQNSPKQKPGLTEEDLKRLQDKARALLDEARRQTEQTDAFNTEKASFVKTIPLIKAVDPNDESVGHEIEFPNEVGVGIRLG